MTWLSKINVIFGFRALKWSKISLKIQDNISSVDQWIIITKISKRFEKYLFVRKNKLLFGNLGHPYPRMRISDIYHSLILLVYFGVVRFWWIIYSHFAIIPPLNFLTSVEILIYFIEKNLVFLPLYSKYRVHDSIFDVSLT